MAISWNNPALANPIRTDVPAIQQLLSAVAKMDPSVDSGGTSIGGIPASAKRMVLTSSGFKFQNYNGSSWADITSKFLHDVDKLDGYHASISAAASCIPVYNSNAQLPCSITGNAATATRFATAQYINIGGTVETSGAVAITGNSNGTSASAITVEVTKVDIGSGKVKGTLSVSNGGTGRTDGAATDVTVTSSTGTKSAKSYGQIGASALKTGVDLNTIIDAGKYIAVGPSVEKNYPVTLSDYIAHINVNQQGTYVFQEVTYCQVNGALFGKWVRTSNDTGASWGRWHCISGVKSNVVTIYLSKSGSDSNTGMTSDLPVKSVSRAMEIATGLSSGYTTFGVNLYMGEGAWGDVIFNHVPFYVYIMPYDGNSATGYVDTLPSFTSIQSVNGSTVYVKSVISDMVSASGGGYMCVAPGYSKIGGFMAATRGSVHIQKDTSYVIDTYAQTKLTYVLRAYYGGHITSEARTINVSESLSLTSFLSVSPESGIDITDITFTKASGATITGKRYDLGTNSFFGGLLTNIPSTSASGTRNTGSLVGGIPYGGGSTATFLRSDGTWSSALSSNFSVGGALTVTGSVTGSSVILSAGKSVVDGTITNQVSGTMGVTDVWHIGVGATASDAGFIELATGDNGTEPIYVRQYNGTVIKNSITLLDANGNTVFPVKVTAPTFVGNLTGTASSASKIGSSTVGGAAKPIYLNGGAPTACSSTVGSASKPVYMNSGSITACSSTIGSGTQPVYMNAGTITASTNTVGGTAKPVYLNAGVITAITSTLGGTDKPVYINAGTITACSATKGSATKPIYMASGTITESNATVGGAATPVYLKSGVITSTGKSFGSVTAGTAGTATTTASSGASFTIPYVTVNSSGCVTAYGGRTHTVTNVSNATTASSCTGNSATATKLATARTIKITLNAKDIYGSNIGTLSGSTTFDGSGNATITMEIGDLIRTIIRGGAETDNPGGGLE